MQKQLKYLLSALLLIGCARRPMPESETKVQQEQPPKKEPPKVEVRLNGDQDDARHLSFKITAIHEKRQPTKEAPFHKDGGEWTFINCQASNDPSVVFAVGVMNEKDAGKAPPRFAWGKALLIVKDREAGVRFVELFGKAFSGKIPKAARQAQLIQPLAVNTAVLGINIHREKGGGFSGEGGDWTATKWFPEHDGLSGEVFFNYNLASRQGEFSEKDPDYADDLVAILASAFRDGPRPERTPQNDPNLTRTGPKIGQPTKLLARRPYYHSFSPNGQVVVFGDKETVFAVPVNKADGKPLEIIRFDNSPWALHIVDDDLNLLAQEGIAETPGVKSSADPMRIWWIDGKKHEKTLLRGPEKSLNVAGHPVSPNQRYVVLDQWQGEVRKGDRTQVLFVLDRDSDKTVTCKLGKKDLSVIGWKQTQGGLRLAAITNRWLFDKNEASELYLVDPATGTLERQENADARLEIDNPLSPDGNHRVRVGKEELVVTEVQTGKQRRFVFHEEDRRFVGSECVEWVSPRYLKFNGQRLALIDVTTMKMSFPVTAEGAKLHSSAYKFSSDFRWVLYQGETADGEGLFLAPVEMPDNH